MEAHPAELSPDRLKKYCEPGQFAFETTKEVPPLDGTIGQDRAVSAIDFGFGIKTRGFNVYVAGPVGTGKDTTVRTYVQKAAEKENVPSDWCYVNNFFEADKPLAIELPPGKGSEFSRDMDELVRLCKTEIPKALTGEEYEKRKNGIISDFQSKRDKFLAETRQKAEKAALDIRLTPTGILTLIMVDGKPLKPEEYDKLSPEKKEEVQRRTSEFQSDVNQLTTKIRALEKETRGRLQQLDREIALFVVGHLLDALKGKYQEYPRITKYLDAVQEDIVEHPEDFKGSEEKPELSIPGLEFLRREPTFEKYRVNVLVNNAETKGAPVVMETNPTYYNLLGRLEYSGTFGAMFTDFTMIKAGAIHRANGGYLVVRALDILTNFLAWDALKRTLRDREVCIENIGEQFRAVPVTTLKPEPIPLNLKVILVGPPLIYYLLYQWDEDFRKLFKVRADFNVEIGNLKENIQKYAAFVSARCRDEGLHHFDRTGVAKLVEYGSRLTENQEKLSTRFMEISDLISEANFWAEQDGGEFVGAEHVEKAVDQKIYRSNMIEEKIQELIQDGTIMIDTEGLVAGQVNGISIYELGDYVFGKPSRITATTYMGKAGVVDIEREAKMSGRIHSKGVMILSGYLGEKYALDKPLSVSASLCFEQLYEEVEGDSASSTELYALLSSLSGIPLKQGIAVTGSVNQRGEIQPVGGINRKIEGFFEVCKVKGLTGAQGVIIPHQNIKNLVLKEEVIQAVRQGKFHIYAVQTIDEGIEILTGVEAGRRQPEGTYPEGTLNYAVDKRLRELAEQLRAFEVPEGPA